ncbi:hypothetical protein AVEN_93862-1 [Araneus ventricosus]|uniref:Uncharacterized protein n=1 Tax=Araneus ventricosus TaxID=182803 RepID=A0A4Y2AZ34_ARAVE|nr:hypothetical protein AVEN_93862-1 [Araneus ventricosus]
MFGNTMERLAFGFEDASPLVKEGSLHLGELRATALGARNNQTKQLSPGKIPTAAAFVDLKPFGIDVACLGLGGFIRAFGVVYTLCRKGAAQLCSVLEKEQRLPEVFCDVMIQYTNKLDHPVIAKVSHRFTLRKSSISGEICTFLPLLFPMFEAVARHVGSSLE